MNGNCRLRQGDDIESKISIKKFKDYKVGAIVGKGGVGIVYLLKLEDNGKNGSTGFHRNGKLRHCELSENHTIDGVSYRRGDLIKFDEDGKLISTK